MYNQGITIGILGGGQLAKFLAVAASKLGYRTHIFTDQKDSPAITVSEKYTLADFSDLKALNEFAENVSLITYEFENIPLKGLDFLAKKSTIYPDKNALMVSQDRIKEKKFFNSLDVNTVAFASVNSYDAYRDAISKIGYPSILKTRTLGYDGKGQLHVDEKTENTKIITHLQKGPCILESKIKFDKEISVIICRGPTGAVISFDPSENIHVDGILRETSVPAQISDDIKVSAISTAGRLVNKLNYVGVMGVEFFVVESKRLLVNEIAPRVHNSGHWTQNGCMIDQFEQHIRAITGMNLGNGSRYANVKMVNLIGEDINHLNDETIGSVYIYGKNETKPLRKMGHINYVTHH